MEPDAANVGLDAIRGEGLRVKDPRDPLATRPRAPILDHALFGVVVLYYLLDSLPRFFQGDSLSYLGVHYDLKGWLPPDRSWVFGALANFLVRATHGYEDYIVLQCALLVGFLLVLRRTLAAEGCWPVAAVAASCLLIAADPLIEVYTRFVMTDFLATSGFILALCAVIAVFRDERRPGLYAALAAPPILAAVLVRSSYALAIEATLALAFVFLRPRLAKRQLVAFACVLAMAPGALGLQLAANRVMFRQEFPHETFVMKNSGVFLAGVFAPALAPADFAKVGAPISQADFDQLDLKNRPLRNAQIWATNHRFLHELLKEKLNTTDDYSAAVDHAAKGLVFGAFRRDPLAVVRVYVQNAADYLTPGRWQDVAGTEMGIDRDLPDDFLNSMNTATAQKLSANLSRLRSVLVREYLALCRFYPIQIALGVAAAIYLLVRERRSASCVFLACAALVTLAMAPLYSVYVIPRYILMTILANYVLIPLAIVSLWRSVVARRPSAVDLASASSAQNA